MNRPTRAVAIVNPAAGNGGGAAIMRRLGEEFRAAGISLELVLTPGPGEATRLARAASEDGASIVVAVGGDGTANEVANGLFGGAARLALYPLGSGNDLARALGYPRRRREVARFIASARERRIDVGDANGRIFVNVAGVGIDGHVAERVRASSRVVGRRLGYVVGSLASIATFRPRHMRVSIDGELFEGPHLAVVVSNGTHFGGGMKPAPHASLDDGWLDVTRAGDLGRTASVAALARLYRGTHLDGRTVVGHRARVVEVELERPEPLQVDGEPLRAAHLSIRVRPGALAVLGR